MLTVCEFNAVQYMCKTVLYFHSLPSILRLSLSTRSSGIKPVSLLLNEELSLNALPTSLPISYKSSNAHHLTCHCYCPSSTVLMDRRRREHLQCHTSIQPVTPPQQRHYREHHGGSDMQDLLGAHVESTRRSSDWRL
jgi:hypothetical protein